MKKEQIETEIREAEEEIRKLRRDKKGNWKQFVKYYEGYIHGLKAAHPKQEEGVSELVKNFSKAVVDAIKAGKTEFEFQGEMHPLHKFNLAPKRGN